MKHRPRHKTVWKMT